MLASYYWLEETYRLHSESLRTVVLDVSELRDVNEDAHYRKALDAMQLSSVKIRAMHDVAGGDWMQTLYNLIPLYSYHDRWQTLDEDDFEKLTHDPNSGTRGYYYERRTYTALAENDKSKVTVLNPVLDKTATGGVLYDEQLYYFDKMATFCKENKLNLLLIKTPTNNWDSATHNAVADLAERYGLEFLDFNFDPYYDAYGYVHAYDSLEGRHMNWYGANKFTDWIGAYLVDNYGAKDVRGNKHYAFMEDVLAEYKARLVQAGDLHVAENLREYMDIALDGNNTLFIAVSDEGSKALTDEMRQYFADLGLYKLSRLGFRDDYIGVISRDGVLYEMLKTSSDKQPLKHSSFLPDGTKYTLVSGRYNKERAASCILDGAEQLYNMRGLNLAVYSHDLDQVVQTATFDTYLTLDRTVYSREMSETVLAAGLDAKYDKDSIQGKIIAYQKKVEEKRQKGVGR